MYTNLKAQMAAQNITIEQVSQLLNVHRNTVANKITAGSFTVEEAFRIKEYLFQKFDLPYLFRRDDPAA